MTWEKTAPWLAVVNDGERSRRFYGRAGWIDEGPAPYERLPSPLARRPARRWAEQGPGHQRSIIEREDWVMVTTPRPIIDSVVQSVCGRAVERIVSLTGGGMNETYRVELSGDVAVIARIARQSVAWFTDEAHLTAQARDVGVPARLMCSASSNCITTASCCHSRSSDARALDGAVGTDAEDMAEERHDPAFWAERREDIEAAARSAS